MSFTEGHALCCDCSDCLNRGGGEKLEGAGKVVTAPRARAKRKALKAERLELLDKSGWTGW